MNCIKTLLNSVLIASNIAFALYGMDTIKDLPQSQEGVLEYVLYRTIQIPKALSVKIDDSSKKGDYLLSADGEKALIVPVSRLNAYLLDTETVEQVKLFKGQNIYKEALSADGKRALIAFFDGTVCRWNTETGEQFQVFEGKVNLCKDQDSCTVSLSADGTTALTGSLGGIAYLWDTETGKKRRAFKHSGQMLSVTLSANGNRALLQMHPKYETRTLCTCGRTALLQTRPGDVPEILYAWDTQTGKCSYLKRQTKSCVVRLSADGKRALAVTERFPNKYYAVCVWDTETGKELTQFEVETNLCSSELSANGNMVLIGSKDGMVFLFDAITGNKLKEFNSGDELFSVAFGCNTDLIALFSKEKITILRNKTLL